MIVLLIIKKKLKKIPNHSLYACNKRKNKRKRGWFHGYTPNVATSSWMEAMAV
jgi:hypothetical protein